MSVQTEYSDQPAVGRPGMLVDGSLSNDIISRVAINDVFAGRGVVMDNTIPVGNGNTASARVPNVEADVTSGRFLGIVVFKHVEQGRASGDEEYRAGDTIPILREGRVWVPVEQAVVAGGQVFCRHAAPDQGVFRANGAGGDASVVPGARFLTSAAAGELAVLEMNRGG